MKLKWITAAVAAAAIVAAVPFSAHYDEESGRKTYTSLSYKIVENCSEGEQGEKKLYPFPMNFMSDDYLAASANGKTAEEIENGIKEKFSQVFSKAEDSENSGGKLSPKDIPSSPDPINIVYDDSMKAEIKPHSFCWTVTGDSGKAEGICADALHPLQSRKYMSELSVKSDKVMAEFPIEPDKVTVRCWPESAWDKIDSVPEEIENENGSFTLKKGGYIYMITLWWESGPLRGSDVSYCFYAQCK